MVFYVGLARRWEGCVVFAIEQGLDDQIKKNIALELLCIDSGGDDLERLGEQGFR